MPCQCCYVARALGRSARGFRAVLVRVAIERPLVPTSSKPLGSLLAPVLTQARQFTRPEVPRGRLSVVAGTVTVTHAVRRG